LRPQALVIDAPDSSWPSRGGSGDLAAPGALRGMPPLSDDKRHAQRHRVLRSAVAVHEDFNISFRCSIRDISEGGARLSMPSGRLVPTNFWLISVTAGMAFQAMTMWRRYPLVGLSLGEALELEEPMTRTARRLQRFWAAANT